MCTQKFPRAYLYSLFLLFLTCNEKKLFRAHSNAHPTHRHCCVSSCHNKRTEKKRRFSVPRFEDENSISHSLLQCNLYIYNQVEPHHILCLQKRERTQTYSVLCCECRIKRKWKDEETVWMEEREREWTYLIAILIFSGYSLLLLFKLSLNSLYNFISTHSRPSFQTESCTRTNKKTASFPRSFSFMCVCVFVIHFKVESRWALCVTLLALTCGHYGNFEEFNRKARRRNMKKSIQRKIHKFNVRKRKQHEKIIHEISSVRLINSFFYSSVSPSCFFIFVHCR